MYFSDNAKKVILAMIMVFVVSFTNGVFSEENKKLPIWHVQKSDLSVLGEEISISSFKLRPPNGYTFITASQAPYGAKVVDWKGTPRHDGTSPAIVMTIVTIPQNEKLNKTIEEVLTMFLGSIKKQRNNWSETVVESGTINGMTFARVYWKGIDKTKNVKMQGHVYATIINGTIVEIASQDVEPYHEESLKIAEASNFTFSR